MSFKLLLINPMNLFFAEEVELNRYTIYEPLALEIIAAYTPDNWEIEILDENFDPIEFRNADLVGVTSFTSNSWRAYEIASMFRKKGVTTVMGGIHASMLPDEALEYVDTAVIGEAESVWPELIRDFEMGAIKSRYQGELFDLKEAKPPRRD